MISVILCTWNNCERLAITLDAFTRCASPPCEWQLVVVANNCTDDTEAVASRFMESLPIEYVEEPRQGLSRARNAGIEAAAGDLFIFADDDIKPAEAWLRTYWDAFQKHPEGVYFGGSVVSEFEGPEPPAELLELAPGSVRGMNLGGVERDLGPDEMFLSANWALPREGLAAAGGFDESRGLGARPGEVRVGEELDLQSRLRELGWRARVLPDATIRHWVPAGKTTLRHIADRFEANGYHEASSTHEEARGEKATLFGVPRWRYRSVLEHWVSYHWRRIRRRDATRPYLKYRWHRGALRAHRDLNRGSRGRPG